MIVHRVEIQAKKIIEMKIRKYDADARMWKLSYTEDEVRGLDIPGTSKKGCNRNTIGNKKPGKKRVQSGSEWIPDSILLIESRYTLSVVIT